MLACPHPNLFEKRRPSGRRFFSAGLFVAQVGGKEYAFDEQA